MNGAYAGLAVLLAMAAISPASSLFSPSQDVDPLIVAALPETGDREARFRLRSSTLDTDCSIAAEETVVEDGRRRLRLDAACARLVPVLEGARWWLERPDGSVAFALADGRVVAEFAAADGAAFESYAPRLPIMTLLAAD